MADFVITSTAIENKNFAVLVAAVEVYIETLDSTNDPIVSINYVYNSDSGTYHCSIISS